MFCRRNATLAALLLYGASAFAAEGMGQANISASVDQRARFSGTFRYAGGTAAEDARRAAIERSVEGMSVFIRSTARSRIAASTQILGSYSFSFQPGKIVVRAEGRPEMTSGDNGAPADYVYNGKRSHLTQATSPGGILQAFVSDDGRRENEFTLSPDGKVLTLKVTLSSARLTKPVIYELPYRRTE